MNGSNLLAVTVVGNDRSGIVAAVTKVLYDLGCNLEDVSSTILRGHFAMMLIVRAPEGKSPQEVETALGGAASDLSLVVTARPVAEARLDVAEPTHMVSVYGADRPGIVWHVADALANTGANITDLTSRVIGSEEEPVYALMLEVEVPDTDSVQKSFATLKEELGIDITLHPIEADVL